MKTIKFAALICLFLSLMACEYLGLEEDTSRHQYMNDSAVAAKVKAALIQDPDIENNNISVNSYQGKVQLSGYVDNKQEVKRAGAIAASVPGVLKVKNNLMVKNETSAVSKLVKKFKH